MKLKLDRNILHFPVPIGNAKGLGEIEYDHKYILLDDHQTDSNSCCFSSLSSEIITER